MTQTTHDDLDHEESNLLALLRLARRHAPSTYATTRMGVARRFEEIDRRRRKLLEVAK